MSDFHKAKPRVIAHIMAWLVLWLTVWSLQCSAQIIHEPRREGLSKDNYLGMVIDSLSIAEEANDTAGVINYASTLATNFQGLTLIERATSYLNTALQYAADYSDHRWCPDVCNRVGMLMAVSGGDRGTARYNQM